MFAFALALVARSSSALTQGDYTYTVNNGLATISKFNASYSGALLVYADLLSIDDDRTREVAQIIYDRYLRTIIETA